MKQTPGLFQGKAEALIWGFLIFTASIGSVVVVVQMYLQTIGR